MPDSDSTDPRPIPPVIIEYQRLQLIELVETWIASFREDGRTYVADTMESQLRGIIGER